MERPGEPSASSIRQLLTTGSIVIALVSGAAYLFGALAARGVADGLGVSVSDLGIEFRDLVAISIGSVLVALLLALLPGVFILWYELYVRSNVAGLEARESGSAGDGDPRNATPDDVQRPSSSAVRNPVLYGWVVLVVIAVGLVGTGVAIMWGLYAVSGFNLGYLRPNPDRSTFWVVTVLLVTTGGYVFLTQQLEGRSWKQPVQRAYVATLVVLCLLAGLAVSYSSARVWADRALVSARGLCSVERPPLALAFVMSTTKGRVWDDEIEIDGVRFLSQVFVTSEGVVVLKDWKRFDVIDLQSDADSSCA